MRRSDRTTAFLACLLLTCTGHAAFDAFLKIGDVDGESTDSKHLKWIDIQSFAHGVARPSGTGAPSFTDLCLQKIMDKSSPLLEQNCAQGKRFPSATLDLITADATRVLFYQIILSNVFVSSISASGAANDSSAKSLENLCLNFSQINWSYTELDANGVPAGDFKAWWDLALRIGDSSVAPAFRVSGSQLDSTTLRLAWPAKAGKTYNILASATVTGSYQVFQTVPATSDGPMSLSLPLAGGANFFRVQEAP